MNKINLDALKIWAARATEDELLVARAQYLAKSNLAEFVLLKIINPRLDYLEKVNVKNIINGTAPENIIKTLIIEPDGECP